MAQSVEHILGKDEVTSSSLVSSSIKSHEKLVGFFIPSNQPFTFFNLIVECEHFQEITTPSSRVSPHLLCKGATLGTRTLGTVHSLCHLSLGGF